MGKSECLLELHRWRSWKGGVETRDRQARESLQTWQRRGGLEADREKSGKEDEDKQRPGTGRGVEGVCKQRGSIHRPGAQTPCTNTYKYPSRRLVRHQAP